MPTKTIDSRKLLAVVAAISIGVGIAATDTAEKDPHPQWENVNVKGSEKWRTLAELRRVSDAHVRNQEPMLDLGRFEITANLYSDKGVTVVAFQYFENFGLPMFYVTLNGGGKVISITNRIAREGR